MNDNLKYLRNKNKQEGDAQKAQKNVEELTKDNAEEAVQASAQKPETDNNKNV